jgi:hypothetical protein
VVALRGDDTELSVVVALLVPGAPVALLSSESTTNWIWPLVGSITRSCTWPRLSPVCPRRLVFMSLLMRVDCPAPMLELEL